MCVGIKGSELFSLLEKREEVVFSLLDRWPSKINFYFLNRPLYFHDVNSQQLRVYSMCREHVSSNVNSVR